MSRLPLLFFLTILFINLVFAQCSEGQIDLNTASATDLDKIIYVGPATAAKIIGTRPFESVNNLINVSGIGEIKLNAIITENLACVEDSKSNKKDEEIKAEEGLIEEEIQKSHTMEISSELNNLVLNKSQETKDLQTIKLNAKDIKEENSIQKNKEGNSVEKYAIFGLVALGVLLLTLLFLQNRKHGFE